MRQTRCNGLMHKGFSEFQGLGGALTEGFAADNCWRLNTRSTAACTPGIRRKKKRAITLTVMAQGRCLFTLPPGTLTLFLFVVAATQSEATIVFEAQLFFALDDDVLAL